MVVKLRINAKNMIIHLDKILQILNIENIKLIINTINIIIPLNMIDMEIIDKSRITRNQHNDIIIPIYKPFF